MQMTAQFYKRVGIVTWDEERSLVTTPVEMYASAVVAFTHFYTYDLDL